MATITVYVLNFYGINSHIELLLQNKSATNNTFYSINLLGRPHPEWSTSPEIFPCQANSVHCFDITADPQEILTEWQEYYGNPINRFAHNNANAAQWFLKKFAGIPDPDYSNFSLNHVALGIQWPSIIPFPITLPGRVMSNVKFHKPSESDLENAAEQSYLYLCSKAAIAALTSTAFTTFALNAACEVINVALSGGSWLDCFAHGTKAIGHSTMAAASTQVLFDTVNTFFIKARQQRDVEQPNTECLQSHQFANTGAGGDAG